MAEVATGSGGCAVSTRVVGNGGRLYVLRHFHFQTMSRILRIVRTILATTEAERRWRSGSYSMTHEHHQSSFEKRRRTEDCIINTLGRHLPCLQTMASMRLIYLCAFCVMLPSCGGERRRAPNQRVGPIDRLKAHSNFNLQQFTGIWHLLSVGSECSYLKINNYRLEGVTMQITDQDGAIRMNTFRKLDGLCWDIKQDYDKAAIRGRFSRKNRGLTTDIVVADTDYSNYAILFLQQRRKLTVKLYGRSTEVDEAVQEKFRQLVIGNNIPEILIYQFPRYGHCKAADEFHQLDDDFGKS
uniref:complement component C8 gamma chain n=1 Tax=Pristiophorus japonicus TaxID=55135 RepID=UPI00398F81BF